MTTASPAPIWIRLPARGAACPWTGLSRSSLLRLSAPMPSNKRKPPVQSVLLACDGTAKRNTRKKGVRLIKLASLLAFIEQQAEQSEAQGNSYAQPKAKIEEKR